MRWFRSNRVFGAQAALFALIVQFTVAFGHVHAGDGAPTAAAAFDVIVDKSGAPAHPEHGQDPADSDCAVCATIQLSGSAEVAAPPALPVPVTYRATKLSLASETAPDDPHCFEQRSRGPPQG